MMLCEASLPQPTNTPTLYFYFCSSQEGGGRQVRIKPLYTPPAIFPSSTSASATWSTTDSSTGRGPVSQPFSYAPPPMPSAFSHLHHGHGDVRWPPVNSRLQGYPLGMMQQAPLQTTLSFYSPCSVFVKLRCYGCLCPLLWVTRFQMKVCQNARKIVNVPQFSIWCGWEMVFGTLPLEMKETWVSWFGMGAISCGFDWHTLHVLLLRLRLYLKLLQICICCKIRSELRHLYHSLFSDFCQLIRSLRFAQTTRCPL